MLLWRELRAHGREGAVMQDGTQELIERVKRTLVGRFDGLEVIGQGGMSVVFRGRDRRAGSVVALKVFRPELNSSVDQRRFLQEGRVTAGFKHPHIVQVLETDVEDGLLFFTMQYVEGENLRERLLREGPLALEDALEII